MALFLSRGFRSAIDCFRPADRDFSSLPVEHSVIWDVAKLLVLALL